MPYGLFFSIGKKVALSIFGIAVAKEEAMSIIGIAFGKDAFSGIGIAFGNKSLSIIGIVFGKEEACSPFGIAFSLNKTYTGDEYFKTRSMFGFSPKEVSFFWIIINFKEIINLFLITKNKFYS